MRLVKVHLLAEWQWRLGHVSRSVDNVCWRGREWFEFHSCNWCRRASHLHELCDRRHSCLIDEKQHVITGRREIRIFGQAHTEPAVLYREGQADEALIHVKRVSR